MALFADEFGATHGGAGGKSSPRSLIAHPLQISQQDVVPAVDVQRSAVVRHIEDVHPYHGVAGRLVQGVEVS